MVATGGSDEACGGREGETPGLIRGSAADIRRAHAVHPITAVEVEYSLWSRDIEAEILPKCRSICSSKSDVAFISELLRPLLIFDV